MANARAEPSKWLASDRLVDGYVDRLRKAGLEIEPPGDAPRA